MGGCASVCSCRLKIFIMLLILVMIEFVDQLLVLSLLSFEPFLDRCCNFLFCLFCNDCQIKQHVTPPTTRLNANRCFWIKSAFITLRLARSFLKRSLKRMSTRSRSNLCDFFLWFLVIQHGCCAW